jgi:alkylation response protein AidB-like acyl-CoA dehydrogenase
MNYVAPVKDMLFTLEHVACLPQLTGLPGLGEAGIDTARVVLEECARLNEDIVAPLNRTGDLQPATLSDGVVRTTPGFDAAFKAYAEGGWQGLQHPETVGGQGLPKAIGTPCVEMLNAANLSFALCPLLTDGAIEALLTAGSPEQQQRFIPPMIEGRWTGTMNLTEPQAGSDLALVRTRAVPQTDGSYRLYGQKIYITYGEHDLAENIIHLVLARTPDAPEGVRGLSLFIVPKFIVHDDGSLGARNDVWCASIEHKLGIKASPTAVLLYGDGHGAVGPGAIGYRIGAEGRGLEYMFIMMNAARFAVGLQGISVADRAYQKAVGYARDREQSRDVAGSPAAVPIIRHPDVRRMLLTMRALTEGARSLAYFAAAACDRAHHGTDPEARARDKALYEFLVPIVKGWSTEMSLEVTSLGVQVHGGMGFIEETGAAQYYRDARILTIYEGTTAIQANDLIGRKTLRDGGRFVAGLIEAIRSTAREAVSSDHAGVSRIGARLEAGAAAFERGLRGLLAAAQSDVREGFAGSVPYLKLAGIVLSAWQLARAALAARQQIGAASADAAFLQAKIATAGFFAEHLLPQAEAMAHAVAEGGAAVMALDESQF